MRSRKRTSVVARRAAPLLLSILAGLGLAGPARADLGSLRVTVRDGETGEPLYAANVLVTSLRDPSLRFARLTNERGRFLIEGLEPGRYEVRASFVGYETGVVEAATVPDGGRADVELPLAVEPIALEKVVVTASRRREKVLDAPAAVQVVDGEDVRERQVLTPADHLEGEASVDVARTGLTQANVVTRGFNNVFSGATLLLVDNRIARVPSLRYNAWNLIPTTNDDIERVEIVSGPGSALYGPNCANGVVHLITRSPFGSEGTTIALAGGDRNVRLGSLRHAGSRNERVGWKVTAQWFQGEDFEYVDPVEASRRQAALDAGADPRTLKIGRRDPDVEKGSAEGRLDVRFDADTQLILGGGANRITSVELTGLGAAQAKDWTTGYAQARLTRGNAFVQAYVNRSDAGDTYNLRTGEDFIDQSTLIVAQAQVQSTPHPSTTLTWGADALLTRPDTEGTINGRNENDDDINELGAYLQADAHPDVWWTFVAAARVDDHNRLDDPVFSPRAAVVFTPGRDHALRATYNRAYSTPSTNNLFLDLLTAADLGDLGAATGQDSYDLRAKGVPEGGFTFRRDSAGGIDGLWMQVPASLGGPGSSRYAAANPAAVTGLASPIPASAQTMWPAAVQAVAAATGGTINLDYTLQPGGTMPGADVGTLLRTLNPTTGTFDPVSPDAVRDVAPLRPTITNTFEVGYKGTLGGRVTATIDVHHDRIEDFIGPLRVETPNVFFDPADPDLAAYLASVGVPAGRIPAVIEAFAGVPLGTVTPENAEDPADLILTYRNFGNVDLTGVDLGVEVALGARWRVGGTYSWQSENLFRDVEGGLDVALNAPKHKAGGHLRWEDVRRGVSGRARVRFVDGFPIQSGVYVGEIGYYTLLDLDASWRLPGTTGTRLSAMVLNALDDEHPEFVGVPDVGRIGIVRLSHTF